MKHYSLIIVLFLVANGVRAQQGNGVQVRLSEKSKEPMSSVVYDLIGSNDDGYFIARLKKSYLSATEIIIEKYDQQLQLKNAKVLSGTVDGEILDYTTAFLFNDKLYAIGYAYFRDGDKKVAYLQEMNTKDLSTPKDQVEMLVMEGIEKDRLGSFRVVKSPDEQLVGFIGFPNDGKIAILDTKKQKVPSTAIVGVFDTQMQQRWSRAFQLDYREKDYTIIDSDIDNKGNFYWLGVNDDGKVDGKRQYSYFMNVYSRDGEKPTEYPLSLDDKFISSCTFDIAPDGGIVISGFYSEKDLNDIKGVFYTRIDPVSRMALSTSFKAFDTAFMSEFMSARKASKGKELNDFDFAEMILREDGGAVLIAQKYYVTTSTTTDNQGRSRTTYTYHYNEMIVSNINPSGEIDWVVRIPKRQAASSTAFLSYTSMVKDDKIYLVFNDNERNLTETKENKIHPYNGKKSVAMLVTIASDGSWAKSALFDNKEEGILLRPKICQQINENTTLLYAEKGRTYKMGLLTF